MSCAGWVLQKQTNKQIKRQQQQNIKKARDSDKDF